MGAPQPFHSAISVTGLVLIVIGGPITLVAAVTMRRSYSSTLVIREDHRLIQHGIYGYLRHPIYFGTTLALMGLPLCISSLYGFLVMLLVIPLFLNRIRIEEGLLLEEFGEEYGEYRKRVPKLVPFVY